MLSLVLFFFLISSGSVFAAAYRKRAYEETVPLTIFCIVEVIFLFGMTDRLRMGVYAVCAACAVLYGLAIRRTVRDRSWRETLSLLLTPAFFIFLSLLAVYAFCIKGLAATQVDCYSFWAKAPKEMWYRDTFHCLPGTTTSFAEYPPGLGLFEVFLLTLRGSFVEWYMMFAYSTLVFSLHLPFLKGFSGKKRVRDRAPAVLIGAVILLSGSVFYPDSIVNLYADLSLGAVFAYGLARVFLLEKKNGGWELLDIADIVMAANMLVLIKSAGRLFAVLLTAALIITVLAKTERREWRAVWKPRRSLLTVTLAVSVLTKAGWKERRAVWKPRLLLLKLGLPLVPFVTAWLWKSKYRLYQQHVMFDESNYNLREFVQILLGRADGGYRASVKDSFFAFLTDQKINVSFLALSNLQIVLLLAAATAVFLYLLRKRAADSGYISVIVLYAGIPVYWTGLLASYMYTFPEHEAARLASMQRYLNIYHTTLVIFLACLLLFWISRVNINAFLSCVVLLAFLSFCSLSSLENLLTGKWVKDSNSGDRAVIAPVVSYFERGAGFQEIAPGILLINQECSNYTAVLKYLLYPMPCSIEYPVYFSSVPVPSAGGSARAYTAEEFRDFVRERGVSHIVIQVVDEDFINTYGSLFDSPLEDGQVYLVREGSALFEFAEKL